MSLLAIKSMLTLCNIFYKIKGSDPFMCAVSNESFEY